LTSRVELLGDRDEGDAVAVEQLDDLGEIHLRPGQTVARFVEAFFQQMDQLRFPPYLPKWREVDIGTQIPGWTVRCRLAIYIKSTGQDAGKPVPGAGSTQQPGSTAPTGAGGDPLTSPTASNKPGETGLGRGASPSDDNEALFRDFVEYQKAAAAPLRRPSGEVNSRT
jgi:hypothetical protein